MADLTSTQHLDHLKPFGHGFEEPRFCLTADIASVRFFNDKQTVEPRHTCVMVRVPDGVEQKIIFFNEVYAELRAVKSAKFIVSAARPVYRGAESLTLYGIDFDV